MMGNSDSTSLHIESASKPHNVLHRAGSSSLRDWSLITGRGGLQNGRGGHVKFYPYKKGGAEKVLAVLKGGAQKVLG